MAKRAVAAKKPEGTTSTEHSKKLVEAIVTVRTLQDFIRDRGGVDAAIGTVNRVTELVSLTGSFHDLKSALEIVGRDPAPSEG